MLCLTHRGKLLALSVAVLCLDFACPRAEVQGAEKRAGATVIDGVRFLPAAKREALLVGGKFAGSNESPTSGFVVLGEIKEQPQAGEWTVLHFANKQPYRWIRFEAAHQIANNVAQFEYLSGSRKVGGP